MILKVIKNKKLTNDVFELSIERPKNIAFGPGSIVVLSVDGDNFRAYSVYSENNERVKFYIRAVGLVSNQLMNLNANDNIEFKLHYRGKIKDVPLDEQACYIAGGTGLAPVGYAYSHNKNSKSTLLVSVRELDEAPWYADKIFATRQQKEVGLISGDRFFARRISKEDIPKVNNYCICGNKSFVETITKYINEVSPNANIIMESF